ncbi:MAG: sorbosone dehydrogenase family protein, partial [Gammaproteobacteria bacterium]
LRDSDGDGVADRRAVFLQDLHSPFGMALVGNNFFVANTNAVMRFPWQAGQTQITASATKVIDLPAGDINQHWTRNLVASSDGERLYVSVGSASNIAEYGIQEEQGRAAIWEVDVDSGEHRVIASGLRNPVGMAWEPESRALWTAVNERDQLGSDLVPDYMTRVRDGDFYGWPWSYYGQNLDNRVQPQRPDLVATAIVPDYALGAHTASLGLSNAQGTTLPERFRNGMFVGQHGSWNRKPRSGYKVIFVPFENGFPVGYPLDVLTGFVDADGNALGRPVGVVIDSHGALLVADDVGNVIWRVTSAGAGQADGLRPAQE